MDAAARDAEELWVIMPFLDRWDLTAAAARDVVLQEGVNTRLLLIDNGGNRETRRAAEDYAQGQVLLWSHNPPLPSLAATWNRALDFVWAAGGKRALILNNDIRLHKDTAWMLRDLQEASEALFISGVGVTEEQFHPEKELAVDPKARGGPDFSCFMISKLCHEVYRFDENFVPCYCEDLDYHRRMMLGGDGRKIFSVNVPFLHVDRGSGTLKGMDEEHRRRKEEQIEAGSRAYYRKKWGGEVNEERHRIPFRGLVTGGPHIIDEHTPLPQPTTTPELQAETWREKADR